MKELYSLRQAAEIIGVSQATIRRAYRRSGLQGLLTTSAILLDKNQVDKLSKHCFLRRKEDEKSRGND